MRGLAAVSPEYLIVIKMNHIKPSLAACDMRNSIISCSLLNPCHFPIVSSAIASSAVELAQQKINAAEQSANLFNFQD